MVADDDIIAAGRFRLRSAVHTLQNGGVIAYPTEAVYGLGCDPWNQATVMRILAMKQRSPGKGLIIIASQWEHTLPFVDWGAVDQATIATSWPGAVTFILPALAGAPWWLTGGRHTIAIRLTAHPLSASLCSLFGQAIVSTSANREGRRPAQRARMVRHIFGDGVDHIVHGALGGYARPSVIRDAVSGNVLRR